MGKQRRHAKENLIRRPVLAALLLCMAAYYICIVKYYDGCVDIPHMLISAQLPILRGVPPYPTQSPEQSSQALEPQLTPAQPDVRIELNDNAPAAPITGLDSSHPRILIYHTHATEAYFKLKEDEYQDNGEWRTLDNTKNIIAVGEKLAELLRREYGIAVIHDTTNHEPPKLATAYSRSVVTMEKYRDEYPSIEMYIDLHRDSYGSDPKRPADYVTVNGKECARMMCVVGTGKGATGTGYAEMPDFDANYALAEYLTDALSAIEPGLTRDIRVKTGRYNQHISDKCLLIEVGHNANTLEQAMNSIDILAPTIAKALDAELSMGQMPLSP